MRDASLERSDRTWALTSIVSLTVLVVASLLLLREMFEQADAILAFVGVLVTASVSLVGILVTRQSNRRLRREAEQAEERLRLDAAMRAGALLAPTDTAPAGRAAAAAGLLSLTRLDQAGLAVALLVDLWSSDTERVSTETAILVMDAALRSKKRPDAQLVAAELLCRNANRLDPCQSLHWPSVVDGCWDSGFSPKTKLLLLDALLQMTLARPSSENALRSIAVRLYGVWQNDPDERVRGCVGTLIGALTDKLASLGYKDFLQGNKEVMLGQLEAAAASATANPDGFLDRLVASRQEDLAKWAATCSRANLGPTGLSTATVGSLTAS